MLFCVPYSFFLEERMLGDIIHILYQNRSNKTKVQVIQTISILVQNIHDEKSLCNIILWLNNIDFILSNNHINSIITAPLDFSDEDIVSQYISFVKMLSLSINEKTIHFFHNNVCLTSFLRARKTRRPLSLCLQYAPSSSTILTE